jgi:hypothetical protein
MKKEKTSKCFNLPKIILCVSNLYSSFSKVLGMRNIHRHTFPFEDVCEMEIEREWWRIQKAVWCILNTLRLYVSKGTILTTTVLFVTYVLARESKDNIV